MDDPSRDRTSTAARAPKPLRIGRLAELTGRSVHTIRWYEAQRLVPGVRRDLQGRRVYHERHVEWLMLLERLRNSGMSIKALREYALLVRKGDASLRERQHFLQSHRKLIERRMEELAEALQIVDGKIEFYARWLSTGVQPQLPIVRRRRSKGPAAERPLSLKAG